MSGDTPLWHDIDLVEECPQLMSGRIGMNNKFSSKIQTLVRSVILLAFASLLYLAITSNEIILYIHPRFLPLTKVTCGVLLFLALVEFSRIAGRSSPLVAGRLNTLTLCTFLLPLFLYLLYPPVAMGSAVAAKKGGIGLNLPKASGTSLDAAYSSPVSGLSSEVMDIADEDYFMIMNDLYVDPEPLLGKVIRYKGFVYKQDDFSPDQFVVGRFTITCCVADASVLGLLCTDRAAAALQDDEWYEVTGRIEMSEEKWGEMPILKVTELKSIAPLQDPYIYPPW